jgi:hypothetical protein
MKTLLLRYTVPIEIDVPDDFPVTTEEIEKIADWKGNDYTDGRHPFTSELLHDAATRAARNHLADAIDDHYWRRVEAWAGARGSNGHREARSALVERCQAKLGYMRLVNGGTIEVAAMWHPIRERYTRDPHIVIAREDEQSLPWDMYGPNNLGAHTLATRTVFEGREAAEAYASGIAPCREPIVAAVALNELRVGEDRGQLDYWKKP